MTCLYILLHWSNVTRIFVTDPFSVIVDAPICNADAFRNLTQYNKLKYIFALLSFNLRSFGVIHSRISAIQCSILFKEEGKFNSFYRDPMIGTAVCH